MERIGQVIKQISPKKITFQNTPKENTEAWCSMTNDCPYCGGAGFVHPVVDGKPQWDKVIPCSCRKDEVAAEKEKFMLLSCHFPPFAEDMSLGNFKEKQGNQEGFKAAKLMAAHPGEIKWLTFIGQNSIGKTHLSIAICKAWVEAGIPARYTFVSILLDELRSGYSNDNPEQNYDAKFKYYCNVPLLLLDDYGAESKTPWVQEKLDTLVDYRLMNNLSLIVTSNLPLDDMPPRIKSRLIRHPKSAVIVMGGEDYKLRTK
jgi:DNA replication protein DnaC